MTYFDVRIPGLKMTVVAADGQYVHPVTVDEFRIATAETFDVIVEPTGQDAFTIFAQDMGRTGYVSGTLAVREGCARRCRRRSQADPDHGRHGPRRHGWRRHDMSAMSVRPAVHARHGPQRSRSSGCLGPWQRWITAAGDAWPGWTTVRRDAGTPCQREPAIRWSTCRPWRRRRSSTIRASACATTAARC
jgi:hypothetical protein